jgi:lysophospholipase L1-like esterase
LRKISNFVQIVAESLNSMFNCSTGGFRLLARALCILLALGEAISLSVADGLQPGDVVAICGDSITKQGLYSAFVETYLRACQPAKDVHAHQFGVSSEKSWEFLTRIDSDVLRFRPTVATIFYGMNDGGYTSADPVRQERYRDAMTEIVKTLRRGGVRFIVIGSPGAVDSYTFDRNVIADIGAQEYNTETLASLTHIARQVSAQQGVVYADVHGIFSETMTKAKAEHGPSYHVAGADGIHPAANGHLIIAYAFLKALGCDGEIATISIDFAQNRATSTEGHRVLSVTGDTVEVESTRYPFCFYGKPGDPDGTRGIIDLLPFNADLNRFCLVVNGIASGRFRVTWGKNSKVFSANELSRGINLAAEFLDNPFSGPFKAVENAVRSKQEFETQGMRSVWPGGAFWPEHGERAALGNLSADFVEKARALGAAARAAIKPVKHTLKIERAP